jgi:DNA gyrase subunit B
VLEAGGAQYAGDDLKRLAREAMAVETLIKRLHARVPDSVLEQAAIAGAFAQGATDKEARSRSPRASTRIAEEGEGNWTGRFDPDGALGARAHRARRRRTRDVR